MRSMLYQLAKIMGDVSAVKNGHVGRRVGRRVAGRYSGRMMHRMFR